MSYGRKVFNLTIFLLLPLFMTGCFTGVESTPRISDSEVRKEKASDMTPEQLFLSDIQPERPSLWKKGKPFKVTDSRISRIFSVPEESVGELVGKTIYFKELSPARTMTGDDATILTFSDDNENLFRYLISGLNLEKIDSLKTLEIPFTVDLDIVARVRKELTGKKYFIKTSAWYNPEDLSKETGLRHIQVQIDTVLPGDSYFPATVCFSIVDSGLASELVEKEHAVLMSIGSSRSATRNFDTLFSFSNPRKEHPEITNDIWSLIISSKVREGMTREECRLALGTAPEVLRTPSYSGMREVWSYSDGVFLIFEDGLLTRYRL